jgi:hypothetical protein
MPEVESRAAYYREQARQIRALISLVVSPEVKVELRAIAEQFERLAETAQDSKTETRAEACDKRRTNDGN